MRKIKRGDTVEVISGEGKGQRGTVRQVLPGRWSGRRLGPKPEADRVLVSGVNLVKKHQRRTGDVRTQFGIIEREAPVHLSNVAVVCSHCDAPVRVGFRLFEDGSKGRFCKRCGELID
ncbi:MAG: 50S ribosomal protein L24 [Chloroflexi bacterium]|nr:50S ribosomal protein L24 [Chloroflexota bacterium]